VGLERSQRHCGCLEQRVRLDNNGVIKPFGVRIRDHAILHLSSLALSLFIRLASSWERKFLGFSFTSNREPKRRIAPKAFCGSRSGYEN
jgi:hypothetical protein